MKYIPVCINVFILVMSVLFLTGCSIRGDYLYFEFGYSYLLLLPYFFAAIVFKFCFWHWIYCINAVVCLFIEQLSVQYGVSISVTTWLSFIFTISAIVITSTIFIYGKACKRGVNKTASKICKTNSSRLLRQFITAKHATIDRIAGRLRENK